VEKVVTTCLVTFFYICQWNRR